MISKLLPGGVQAPDHGHQRRRAASSAGALGVLGAPGALGPMIVLLAALASLPGCRPHEAPKAPASAAPAGTADIAALDLQRGAAALARGQVAEAEAAWERCLAWRERRAPSSAELADVLDRLAGIALGRHDLDRAEALAGRALAIVQRLHAPRLAAMPLMLLGSAARERGDPERAERLLQQALALHPESAPDAITADALNRLGTVSRRRGDLDQAQQRLQRALALWDRYGAADPVGRTNVLLNLGWVASDRGDLATARRLMEEAVAVRERLQPDTPSLAGSLDQLSLVVSDQGDYETARALLQRQLGILARTAPNGMGEALALGNLGDVELHAGNPDRAADLCRRAVALEERLVPGNPMLAGPLETLAQAELARGHLDEAWSVAGRAAKMQEGRGGDAHLIRASLLAVRGEIARRRGDRRLAENLFRQALAIDEGQGYGSVEVADLLHGLGLVTWDRPALAARYLEEAVALVEQQVHHLGGSREMQTAYRARRASFYRDAIALAVERRRPRQALGLLERSRGQALLAQLAARDAGLGREVPAALRREEREVAAAIDAAELDALRFDRAGDAARLAAVRGRLAELHRREGETVERIRQASPRYAALVHPAPLDLEATRRALRGGTVMLAYSLGERGGTLFVLSADAPLVMLHLPAGEAEVRQRVLALRGLIAGEMQGIAVLAPGRRAEEMRLARELYDLLLRPAAARIEAGRRLLVVPDGVLHLLPWAALARPVPAAAGGRSWGYVAEWRPIHVADSATVFDSLRRRQPDEAPAADQEKGPALVAFADPEEPSWLRSPAARLASDVVVRSAFARGSSFAPLPFARQEVAGIAGLFPGAAKVFVGAAATEERIKALGRAGGRTPYLHLATHTTLDELSPLDSAVVLAIPDRLLPGRENGLLQAWEVFDQVHLDADLVVLSGCESALGKEVAGEGLMGLTRAFQYAGAHAVVASLWQVSDRMTAPLMVSFYRGLRAGLPKDEALRRAQVELLRAAAGGTGGLAPFYWAGFELFGDWS